MSAEPNRTERDYELLSAYIDGELTEAERSALEARLVSDAALRRELSALRQTVALVNQLPTLKAPHNFTLDAAHIPPRVIPFPQARRRINLNLLTAVAAMVAVVLFAGIVMTSLLGPAVGNVFSNIVHNLQPDSGGYVPPAAQVAAAATTAAPSPTPSNTAAGPLLLPTQTVAAADFVGQDADQAATQQSTTAEKTLDATRTTGGDNDTLAGGAADSGAAALEMAVPSLPGSVEPDASPETLGETGAFRLSPTQMASEALPPAPTGEINGLASQSQVAPQESPLYSLAAAPQMSPTAQPTAVAADRSRDQQAQRDEQVEEAARGVDALVVIVIAVGVVVAGVFVAMRSRQP